MRPTRELDRKNDPFRYKLSTVLRSPWYMDATRALDRLSRYQSFLRHQIDWQDLTFGGKTILEIGCGPLLGWAPIAAYLGCNRYICVEPGLRENPANRSELVNNYFLPLYRHLKATIPGRVSFSEFKDLLNDRVETYFVPFEQHEILIRRADIVISNNVLQHVQELELCFDRIRQISHADTRQFHNVHFTDHFGEPEKPFDGIYTISPKQYFESHTLLNLKRPSEILTLFQKYDLPVRMVPYFSDDSLPAARLNAYWTRFSPEDLAIHVGFYVT